MLNIIIIISTLLWKYTSENSDTKVAKGSDKPFPDSEAETGSNCKTQQAGDSKTDAT